MALIKVDPDGLDLRAGVALRSRPRFAVGEPVAAIGSPFGEDQSLSIGVISATDRTIEGLTNFGIDNAIQTDASINPGNSGGPLLDSKGEVIGINQQIASDSGSNSGVGFAIPVTSVRYSLDQLRGGGKVDYAFLGVTTESLYPQLADHLGIDAETGALITDVVGGSPADKAGLKGSTGETTFQLQHVKTGGDVVIAVDGKPVFQNNDLAELIARHKPGDTVTLDIIRDGQHATVDVTLGSRPGDVKPVRADGHADPRAGCTDLAATLREEVLPHLGAHAGRAHSGRGRGRRRHLRDRRARRAADGGLPGRAGARGRLLLRGPRPGLPRRRSGRVGAGRRSDRRHAAGAGRPRVLLRLGRRRAGWTASRPWATWRSAASSS